MPHSFPKSGMPAEIRWGRPPRPARDALVPFFLRIQSIAIAKRPTRGQPRTWASAPPFMQMPENRENYAALGRIATKEATLKLVRKEMRGPML
jgi:hypothetical protein